MKSDTAALGRSPQHKTLPSSATPGVNVDTASLAALEAAARDFHFLSRQPVHSLLSGRHGSRVRGRGLAFEELRPYLPGDDVRTMDWRVTARTGKPHVRVYAEEKERPALVVVDQRINMFFGSRRAMKSVAAAEVAALATWRMVVEGDRVGGVVFGDKEVTALAPQRSQHGVLHLLGELARHNQALRADAPASQGASHLNAALQHALQLARRDYLVIVISDFSGNDAQTRDLMLELRRRNDMLSVLVYDPFLLNLPDSGHLVVSDGELQVELGFGRETLRSAIHRFADDHNASLVEWHNGIGVPLLPISAAEDTALQLRRLLGYPADASPRRGKA
ncbi:DUF58 domain-containing protein [Cupriavidus metallidurans]|uniref:DUF58 domain-containing protein n=1 Tax=Cupriavidus metallidurans TaxID=119219 RepID=UPI001645A630|nr:DUF58 domain-containing protein [Cupriavidus metallidurans]